jgi:hypothetical protein
MNVFDYIKIYVYGWILNEKKQIYTTLKPR